MSRSDRKKDYKSGGYVYYSSSSKPKDSGCGCNGGSNGGSKRKQPKDDDWEDDDWGNGGCNNGGNNGCGNRGKCCCIPGPQGPAGPAGPPGPAGTTPTATFINTGNTAAQVNVASGSPLNLGSVSGQSSTGFSFMQNGTTIGVASAGSYLLTLFLGGLQPPNTTATFNVVVTRNNVQTTATTLTLGTQGTSTSTVLSLMANDQVSVVNASGVSISLGTVGSNTSNVTVTLVKLT